MITVGVVCRYCTCCEYVKKWKPLVFDFQHPLNVWYLSRFYVLCTSVFSNNNRTIIKPLIIFLVILIRVHNVELNRKSEKSSYYSVTAEYKAGYYNCDNLQTPQYYLRKKSFFINCVRRRTYSALRLSMAILNSKAVSVSGTFGPGMARGGLFHYSLIIYIYIWLFFQSLYFIKFK